MCVGERKIPIIGMSRRSTEYVRIRRTPFLSRIATRLSRSVTRCVVFLEEQTGRIDPSASSWPDMSKSRAIASASSNAGVTTRCLLEGPSDAFFGARAPRLGGWILGAYGVASFAPLLETRGGAAGHPLPRHWAVSRCLAGISDPMANPMRRIRWVLARNRLYGG